MNPRERVLEYLDLLSQPSRQLDFEARVAIANSHGALVSRFCDDLFRPKSRPFLEAFTENEIKDLARLYGLLIESRQLRASSLADQLREPEWRRIARFAMELVATMDVGCGQYALDPSDVGALLPKQVVSGHAIARTGLPLSVANQG